MHTGKKQKGTVLRLSWKCDSKNGTHLQFYQHKGKVATSTQIATSQPQAQGHNYNLTQAADAGRTHTHTHRVQPNRRETAFTCKKTPE